MIGYLEDRLGIVTAFRASMSRKRPPRGIGYLRTIGFAALTVMVLQFFSGFALALHYVPTTELAYDSIRAIEADLTFGGLAYGVFTRSLHHFGASAFVIFVALHMARVFFTGAYKRPREFTWLTGVGLLLVVLAFGFTGYLLPWDQKAYFATKVGTQIAADTPVIGDTVRAVMRGGEDVGQPTLTRFYVVHVVLLPIALLGLLGLHFFLIQRHGVAAPKLPVGDEGEKGPTYFPHHTLKEALVGVVVAAGLFAISYYYRAPLEELAEPADTSYVPRPDWYFLGLFELLKLFKGDKQVIATIYIPAVSVAALVLLPFVDRGRHRDWRKRWFMIPLGLLACATVVTLTVVGWRDDPNAHAKPEKEKKLDGRIARDGLTWRLPLGYTNLQRRGYLLIRRHKCMDCHHHVVGADRAKDVPLQVYGTIGEDTESYPRLGEIGGTIEDVVAALVESPSEDMPSFANLPADDMYAIGAFVMRFQADLASGSDRSGGAGNAAHPGNPKKPGKPEKRTGK